MARALVRPVFSFAKMRFTPLKSLGNLILMTLICLVIFWIFMALRPARAGAYNPMRSCGWSITAACAAMRNGGSYTRDGITHRFVGRYPNGAIHIHVYRGGARVK